MKKLLVKELCRKRTEELTHSGPQKYSLMKKARGTLSHCEVSERFTGK